jgi:FtsH-binding integral membrane protein
MSNFNQQEFSDFTVLESKQGRTTTTVSKKYMAGVFTWMFIALGLSTLFAVLFSTSPDLLQYLFRTTEKGVGLNMLGWAVMLAPLGFV